MIGCVVKGEGDFWFFLDSNERKLESNAISVAYCIYVLDSRFREKDEDGEQHFNAVHLP